MAHMKEQIKTPDKVLNKMEISNLSDAEFKTLVIRMLKEISEDLNSIKKTQSEMEDSLIEITNNLHRNNSRLDEAENQVSNLEHKEAKNNQSEQNEKKRISKNEDSVSSLWDNLKHYDICIIGVPEGEEEEQEIGNIFGKIMKETPNLLKKIDMQVQEAQRVPIMMDERPTPRHLIIKMPVLKGRQRILKASREKKLVTHRGVSIRLSADFLKETLQATGD